MDSFKKKTQWTLKLCENIYLYSCMARKMHNLPSSKRR